jgi:hypothetical protein
MVGDGAMQLPQRWRGWDATPWGDGLLTCPTTGNHSPGIPRPLLALFSPAIRDMAAADLVGLEKNQKEECDSSIPRSRTGFELPLIPND